MQSVQMVPPVRAGPRPGPPGSGFRANPRPPAMGAPPPAIGGPPAPPRQHMPILRLRKKEIYQGSNLQIGTFGFLGFAVLWYLVILLISCLAEDAECYLGGAQCLAGGIAFMQPPRVTFSISYPNYDPFFITLQAGLGILLHVVGAFMLTLFCCSRHLFKYWRFVQGVWAAVLIGWAIWGAVELGLIGRDFGHLTDMYGMIQASYNELQDAVDMIPDAEANGAPQELIEEVRFAANLPVGVQFSLGKAWVVYLVCTFLLLLIEGVAFTLAKMSDDKMKEEESDANILW